VLIKIKFQSRETRDQAPNFKQTPNPNIQWPKPPSGLLGVSNIVDWNLFGAWNLVLGIWDFKVGGVACE
jgi:hypothetical protein